MCANGFHDRLLTARRQDGRAADAIEGILERARAGLRLRIDVLDACLPCGKTSQSPATLGRLVRLPPSCGHSGDPGWP